MTVATTHNRNSYACDGSTVIFPYTFKIFKDSDLVVKLRDSAGVETLLVLTTDYTVSGAGAAGGGNVTTVATYASGNTLVIRRSIPLSQLTDYVENDPFLAATHEEVVDRAVMITQQLEEILGRAIKFAETSSESDVAFPDPIASKFIRWNDAGNALELGDVVATGSLTLPVAIADGGTAASTKAGARTSLEVGKITWGVDASKAASPALGSAYYATDTDILYICFTAGTWRSFKPFAKGADVASASALPLIADGNYVDVTGTTTITSMNSVGIGTKMTLHFDGALQITHHATNLILPGGVNITTVAGDELEFTEYASGNWRLTGGNSISLDRLAISGALTVTGAAAVLNLTLSGAAPSPPVANRIYKENIIGGSIKYDQSATITINDSFNVASIVDNGAGDATISWDLDFADADYAAAGMSSQNETEITTQGAGTLQITTRNAGGTATDAGVVCVIASGDQ